MITLNYNPEGHKKLFESSSKVPISVIVPCYCCSETIRRALYSVLDQTLLPNQIVLVEDASPDVNRTLNELHSLEEELYDKVETNLIKLNENVGPGEARNIGWSVATQPYIAFLDADDSWHPQKIELQYGFMKSMPDVMITAHRTANFKEGMRFEKIKKEINVRELRRYELLLSNRISTPSVMCRRDLNFRFNPQKRFSEDYDLWLRIICKGIKIFMIEHPLCFLRRDYYYSGGLSSRLVDMERGELDNFRGLYRERCLSLGELLIFTAISKTKFLRRYFYDFFRRKIA